MAQTLSGRNLRFYFNGSAVGMGRVSMLKPDLQIGLDAVKEVGTPTVLEYVPKIPETSLSMGYALINKAQLALAMGQQIGALDSTLGITPGSGTPNVGEVPSIPQSFDVVERRIKPGTEGSQAEVITGYTIYQAVAVEKQSWDQEVDKLVAVDISGKCKAPRDYENINGIQFDRFVGNGSTTAFITTHKPIMGKDGYLTIRSESPYLTVLKEGSDYTVASTASNATVTYAVAPASSTAQNTLIIYAW
jgi:hypothetical protein